MFSTQRNVKKINKIVVLELDRHTAYPGSNPSEPEKLMKNAVFVTEGLTD